MTIKPAQHHNGEGAGRAGSNTGAGWTTISTDAVDTLPSESTASESGGAIANASSGAPVSSTRSACIILSTWLNGNSGDGARLTLAHQCRGQPIQLGCLSLAG